MKIKYYFSGVKIRALWITLFLLFFSGCSYWTDFTTYFNLYYNASVKFDEVNEQLKSQKKELFSLTDTKPTGNVNESLNKVIEKLSKILQFYKESSYFDDALLMIGKSFYLEQDYIKALRKFEELVNTFPDGDLLLEGKLWIGKTDFRLKKFDEGNKIFDEIQEIAEKEDETEILSDIYAERVSYFISIENYPEAVANAEKLVEVSGDDEKNAQVMYELGKLYLKIDQPENASKSFRAVDDYSPDFETEFQAKLEFGKTQRLLGNNEIAMEVFDDIFSESIYNEYLDQTELQIGITQIALDKYQEAFDKLTEIDTVYKQSQSSGLAKYYLGEIMEKHYGDYDSANVYYSRALTASLPTEMIDQVKKKSEIFTKYKKIKTELNQFNKQLAYLDDPEEFIKDSLAYVVEKARVDSLNKIYEMEQMEENGRPESQDSSSQQQQQEPNGGNPPQQQGNNITPPSGDNGGGQPPSGNVGGPQQGQRNSRKASGEDNTRQNSFRNKRDGEGTAQEDKMIKPAFPEPLRPTLKADSIHSILAKNEYELAGLFLTELNNTDSASFYFSRILSKHPKSNYIARSIFALGTCYLTLNQQDKADSLFEIVYNDYKNEKIANAAANKLNKPLINFDFDPAEDLYVLAENKMKEELYVEALNTFKEVSEKYPTSGFAPKSWLSRGWIFENNLKQYDSAAVMYDSIISKYPGSEYAKRINSELSFYKTEKKRIAMEDSLRADSIANVGKEKLIKANAELQTAKTSGDSTVVSDSTNMNPANVNTLPAVSPGGDSLKVNQTDSLAVNKKVPTKGNKPDNRIKPPQTTKQDTAKTTTNKIPVQVDSSKANNQTNVKTAIEKNKVTTQTDSLKNNKAVVDSSATVKSNPPVENVNTPKVNIPADTTKVNQSIQKADSTKTNLPGSK